MSLQDTQPWQLTYRAATDCLLFLREMNAFNFSNTECLEFLKYMIQKQDALFHGAGTLRGQSSGRCTAHNTVGGQRTDALFCPAGHLCLIGKFGDVWLKGCNILTSAKL